MEVYLQDRTFDRNSILNKGEYENCSFNGSNFAENNLSDFKFIECTFENCNLSLAKVNKTTFQSVIFKNCKLVGIQFDACNEFGLSFSFDNCQLNHSSFYKIKMKKTVFKNAQLVETDFSECDLTGAVFNNCDLLNAVFDNTTLEKADLRSAYNYSIDPEKNRIKKAKFSAAGISGLLHKYDIEIDN